MSCSRCGAPTADLHICPGLSDQAHDVEAVEVFDSTDVCDQLVEATIVEEVRPDHRAKRRRHSAKNSMSAEDAQEHARREGLGFVRSATAKSGFHLVNYDPRSKGLPFKVFSEVGKPVGSFLGSYATAEEAALVYARHVGNKVDRCATSQGCSTGTREALEAATARTVVCKEPGCKALVHLASASTAAISQRGRDKSFEPGDGCRSATCATNFDFSQFKGFQTKMASALLSGKRRLVAWPDCPGHKKKPLSENQLDEAVMRAAVEDALAALECVEESIRDGTQRRRIDPGAMKRSSAKGKKEETRLHES